MPRKQIAFDLNTKALEKFYPRKNWRAAYDDIQKYMTKADFKWEQGSVYVSNKELGLSEIFIIINRLTKKHDWINVCMRDCKQTDIGANSNINMLFDPYKIIKKTNYLKRMIVWFKKNVIKKV